MSPVALSGNRLVVVCGNRGTSTNQIDTVDVNAGTGALTAGPVGATFGVGTAKFDMESLAATTSGGTLAMTEPKTVKKKT